MKDFRKNRKSRIGLDWIEVGIIDLLFSLYIFYFLIFLQKKLFYFTKFFSIFSRIFLNFLLDFYTYLKYENKGQSNQICFDQVSRSEGSEWTMWSVKGKGSQRVRRSDAEEIGSGFGNPWILRSFNNQNDDVLGWL